jgi:lipopolysaccharide export system permease protein
MLTVWQRYFLKQWLKMFLLFLFCFYGLYVLIDYASHTGTFHHQHIKLTWKALAFYYGAEFVKRLDIILPFGMLIATVRTLCLLNTRNELVALLAGGIRLRTLLRPFVVLGLIGVAIVYLNSQLFVPYALGELKRFNTKQALNHSQPSRYPEVRHLTLEDGTALLFHHYDAEKERFLDTYWVHSIDEIYHMKILNPHASPPVGVQVDRISRTSTGSMAVADSAAERAFPEMRFSKQGLTETITPPEELSVLELWDKLPEHRGNLSEKEAQKLTIFYRKLAMPWLCLLAILGPAPFCIRFTRQLPVFFIYAGSIFGLVAVYLVMNAATVLGERQVLPPAWAIWPPFILFTGTCYGLFRFTVMERLCRSRG